MTILLQLVKKIDNSKSLDELFSVLSAFVIKQSFLQMGSFPQRGMSENKVTFRRENWKFDRFRTVLYLQSQEQKENLFLEQAAKGNWC